MVAASVMALSIPAFAAERSNVPTMQTMEYTRFVVHSDAPTFTDFELFMAKNGSGTPHFMRMPGSELVATELFYYREEQMKLTRQSSQKSIDRFADAIGQPPPRLSDPIFGDRTIFVATWFNPIDRAVWALERKFPVDYTAAEYAIALPPQDQDHEGDFKLELFFREINWTSERAGPPRVSERRAKAMARRAALTPADLARVTNLVSLHFCDSKLH